MLGTLLQQEPSSPTTAGTKHVTTMEFSRSHPSTLAIIPVAGVVPRFLDIRPILFPTTSALEEYATKHQVIDMAAIDDKVGFFEHGSELPHEHNSQLEREEEPGGSAQQYTLTSSVYATMPEKVKAMSTSRTCLDP